MTKCDLVSSRGGDVRRDLSTSSGRVAQSSRLSSPVKAVKPKNIELGIMNVEVSLSKGDFDREIELQVVSIYNLKS
jgi:hypothetical protein